MLVNLVKTSLIKEMSDSVDEIYILKDSSSTELLKELKFQSFIGFNKIAARIIKEGPTFFKFFKFVKTGGKGYSMMFSVPYTKKSQFIFDYLKTLGITLTELSVEFGTEGDTFVMNVHHKIMKIINLGSTEVATSLTYYLYCLCKLFTAIANNPRVIVGSSNVGVASEKRFVAEEVYFDNLYDIFNRMSDEVVVNVMSGTTAESYDGVAYYTKCINSSIMMKHKSSSEYLYNVISTDHKKILVLHNKNFNETYVVDMNLGVIYTNNTLQRYNTLDYNEWIPYLVNTLCKVKKYNPKYTIVQYVNTNELLSEKTLGSSKSYLMQTDLEEFEEIMSDLEVSVVENYNIKLYDPMCKDITLKSAVVGTDLSEEYKDDEYAQQLYTQVQSYYDTFDLKDLTNTVRGFATGEIYSMLFIGDSGTGKSTAAKVIPHKCGLPYVVINCSTNIEETDMFGTMIPNPKKVTADDPEFVWEDGILTKAIRNGYCAVIEELNFARPGVLGKLNSLLDESRQIDLANGEIVKAHKNFRLVVTCNVGYEGTNRLNKALINRFEICKLFKDLEKSEAVDIIQKRIGYTDMTKINAIYDVYHAIKKYSNEQNLGIIISIRQLMNVFRQGKYYKTASQAVYNTLLNAAFLEEPEHLEYFTKTVLPAFDLNFKI